MSNLRKGLVVAVSSILAVVAITASAQAAVVVVQPPDTAFFTVTKILNHGIVGGNAGGALDPSRYGQGGASNDITDEELEDLADDVRRKGGDVDDPSRLSNTEIGGWVLGQQGDRTIIEIEFPGGSIIIQVPTVYLNAYVPNAVGLNAHGSEGDVVGAGQEYASPPPPPSGSQGEVDEGAATDSNGNPPGTNPCSEGEVDINGDPIPR